MSLVINSNAAAGMAANHLAASNRLLERSLNRLSSGSKIVNPSDDAGGLAVSMKMGATTNRQQAVNNNIANAQSFLQTQDGALKVAGKLLDRISELKVLYEDTTKNDSDKNNYDVEFIALRDQLLSLSNEHFNGINLFGTSELVVNATEDGSSSSAVRIEAMDLFTPSTGSSVSIFDNFSGSSIDSSLWSTLNLQSGLSNVTQSGGVLTSTDRGWLVSNQDFSGRLDINARMKVDMGGSLASLFWRTDGVSNTGSPWYWPSTGSAFTISAMSNRFEMSLNGTSGFVMSSGISANQWYDVRVVDDGVTANVYINGASAPTLTMAYDSSSAVPDGKVVFNSREQFGTNFSASLDSLTVNSSTVSPPSGQFVPLANAGSLSQLSMGQITDSIQAIASFRAQNGSNQSRLSFASEMLTVNQANMEAANSRIADVDVAQESTQLARANILVQAGTSMLSQANQSPQTILRLLQ